MDELLSKAKINEAQVKRIVVTAVAQNLSSLSEPCVYPSLKKHFFELLRATNLTEQDVRKFTRNYWAGRKEARFQLHNSHVTMFYIFLMYYFLAKKRNQLIFNNLMNFFMIRIYANLMPKQLKFCVPEVFSYALQTLTKTHLFSREKTIPNALYFLSNAMIGRWSAGIKSNDKDAISKFIQDSRTRVSQSVKSFVSTYMRASEAGAGIQTQELPSEENPEVSLELPAKTTKLVDEIVRKVTVYKFVDKKAIESSRKIARINVGFINAITTTMIDVKYSDNIRLVLQLFVKDLNNVVALCGKDYEKYVRDLMAIKRTRARIYFKQQVDILSQKLLKDSKMKSNYDKLTSQTKFLVNLFLAYYLTSVLKNRVC